MRLRSSVYEVAAMRPFASRLFVGKQDKQLVFAVNNQFQFLKLHDKSIVDFNPGGRISSRSMFSVLTVLRRIHFHLWWIPWDRGRTPVTVIGTHDSYKANKVSVRIILARTYRESRSVMFRFCSFVHSSFPIRLKLSKNWKQLNKFETRSTTKIIFQLNSRLCCRIAFGGSALQKRVLQKQFWFSLSDTYCLYVCLIQFFKKCVFEKLFLKRRRKTSLAKALLQKLIADFRKNEAERRKCVVCFSTQIPITTWIPHVRLGFMRLLDFNIGFLCFHIFLSHLLVLPPNFT